MSLETEIIDINENALIIKKDPISYMTCPECPLPAKFNIETNKNNILVITSCQEKHNVKIELKEYLDNQYKKNLICNKCKDNILSNQIKSYYCFKCKEYFCHSCKTIHKDMERDNVIANLSKLGTKCICDNKESIGYCQTCNKSFCNFCKIEHNNHFICDSSNLILSYTNVNLLQNNINIAQNHIEKIKSITNSIIKILQKKIEEIKINSEKFIQINQLELDFSKEILSSYTSKQNNKSCIYEVIENALNFLNFNIKKPFKTDLIENINIDDESSIQNQKIFDSIGNYLEYLKNPDNYILKPISKNKKNFPFQLYINNNNINNNNINKQFSKYENQTTQLQNNKNMIISNNNIISNNPEIELQFTSKEIIKLNELYERFEEIKNISKEKIMQYIKKKFQNGIFFGEWNIQTNLPHGRGILYENNGDIYQGYFLNGEKNGFGILFFYKNYSIYRGEFENNKLKFGTLSFPNGKFYRGNFLEGKYNGIGILYNENYIYEGEFIKGKKEGYGIYKTNDGIYEGIFKGNTYFGFGKWKWNNGDCYIGNWENGIPSGFGNLSMASGKVYSGEFSPDKDKNPMYCNIGGKKEFSYMKIED